MKILDSLRNWLKPNLFNDLEEQYNGLNEIGNGWTSVQGGDHELEFLSQPDDRDIHQFTREMSADFGWDIER